MARQKGVALILGGVFQNGVFINVHPEWLESPPKWMSKSGYNHSVTEVQNRLRRLYELQRDSGFSLVTMTIRYLIADTTINTILIGAARSSEVEESVLAAQAGRLPSDLHQAIEELGLT